MGSYWYLGLFAYGRVSKMEGLNTGFPLSLIWVGILVL